MRVTIVPSPVTGRITANPSKSHAQRALAIAALATGTSRLHGIGASADVQSALGIVRELGAGIVQEGEYLYVNGGNQIAGETWACGESGLCLRMFSGIAALYDKEITLTAEGTLIARPMDFMAGVFQQLGVSFIISTGSLRIHVKGPIRNHQAVLDGSISSQFLTGLLIALPLVTGDSLLTVTNLKSRPYIDLTMATMREFGVQIGHKRYRQFHIPGGQSYHPAFLSIQGDWSGMAFLLVAAALTGDIAVTGLPVPDHQPDGRIVEALDLAGATVQYSVTETMVRARDLCAFDFDCTHCPDLFPPLVALGALCKGTSRISGLHRLKFKESDRGLVLIQEFLKLGIRIWQEDDLLCVEGGQVIGGIVNAHGDHRIAMALAVVALRAAAPVMIAGAECVDKSYPNFFHDLSLLGVTYELFP